MRWAKKSARCNGNKNQGSYSAFWNGKNEAGKSVSKGAYLYELKAEDKSIVKKMLLTEN